MTSQPSSSESLLDALKDLPRLIREQQERDGTCTHCNGMGGSFTGYPIRVFSRDCHACNGTGKRP